MESVFENTRVSVYEATKGIIHDPGTVNHHLESSGVSDQFLYVQSRPWHRGTVRLRGLGTEPIGTYLGICLSSPLKNGNCLTWVLAALTVCFTYPVLYRVSAESRAGEWEL